MTDDPFEDDDDVRSVADDGEMSRASLSDDSVSLTRLAADDRLAMLEPTPPVARRLSRFVPVVGVSLAVHVAVGLTFVLVAKVPPPVAEQQETPVEVVQEPPHAPEPKKEANAAPEVPKPEDKPIEAEKPKMAQEPPAQPDPKPAELKPSLPAKQDAASQPKAAQPQQTAKLEPDPKPSEVDKAAEEAKTLKSLQDELAALKAQAADLKTQAATHQDSIRALGLLPDSFAAIAAPSLAADGEDPVTYQQAVYSMIDKAKKSGRVYIPGVAHVVFNIGTNGELLDVTLDHSSGNPVVDEEAVAIVRRAAPFPPPPPGSSRSFPAYMSFVAE